MKLELAIIENLQREDLNALDRAKAFKQLVDQFGLQHKEIGARVGKSREYVSNTLRILALPEVMQTALEAGEISEGHTRPLLMLADRLEEQMTLFKEIVARRLTVRDAEALARRVAIERVRHKALVSPDLMSLEKQLSERLGTRVRIEKKDTGGKLHIDFFSPEDLTNLCIALTAQVNAKPAEPAVAAAIAEAVAAPIQQQEPPLETETMPEPQPEKVPEPAPQEQDDDLYSVKNFSL